MRRSYYRATGGGGDFTLINYLESVGSNPVNSSGPIIITNLDTYYMTTEIKVKQAESYPGYTNQLLGAAGCWNDNNNRYYVCNKMGSTSWDTPRSGIYYADKSNNYTAYTTTNDTVNPHIIIYNQGNNCGCYYDGVLKGTVSNITTNNLPYKIALFGQNSISFRQSSWRIYYAKFTYKQTNTVVGYFLPALDSDNVPCMYDEVTDSLFYNQGTGTFTYG